MSEKQKERIITMIKKLMIPCVVAMAAMGARSDVIPAWAVGSYSGSVENWCYDYDDPDDVGPWYGKADFSVSADGKISGEVRIDGIKAVPVDVIKIELVSDSEVYLQYNFKWRTEDGQSTGPSHIYIRNSAGTVTLEYADHDENNPWETCPVEGILQKRAESFIAAAETFDGYVVDGDGAICGTVQVKAAKPNKKTGASKLTAAVTMLGEKKVSIKGETIDGSVTLTAKDGRVLELNLAKGSMSGSFDGNDVVIARNVFAAKDASSKSTAASALENAQGVYVAALLSDSGVGALSIDVKAKGKVKVSGNLADGTKVSANSQLIVMDDGSCEIPVLHSKKQATFVMVVKIALDGAVSATGYDTALFPEVKIAKNSGSVDATAVFSIDADAVAESFTGVAEINIGLLPNGVEVTQSSGKWSMSKAGKVKYKNGVWDVSGENPAALKLSYKAKTGMFTGSFNVYGVVNGRLKKYSVKINGVVIDGVGYGVATLKKPVASWSVRIAE
jgi:hypothetical protein